MKNFNICLIKPDNYVHSYAFSEIAELIYFSLRELNVGVTINFNKVEPSSKNILIGCHLLHPNFISQIPASTIILNTEQICDDLKSWNQTIFDWAKNFEVWDYSEKNIEKFKQMGVDKTKLFKIGFQKELVRISHEQIKDIDILFYGHLNERREIIIDALEKRGLKVKTLFGIFGRERDEWIARSKIVLNHHFYNSQIFEIVRVFYLLTNSVAVVGEVNPATSINSMYLEGIYPAKYEDLLSKCIELIANDRLRHEVEMAALQSIIKFPQKEFIRELID